MGHSAGSEIAKSSITERPVGSEVEFRVALGESY